MVNNLSMERSLVTHQSALQLQNGQGTETGSKVEQLKQINGLRVVSLFSGAGGLDLGFEKAGHHVIWANDNDQDSVATYQANLSENIVLADVADIDPKIIPDADILIGGLPCQGFSLANVNKVDGDARNDLYAQFVRILQAKRPKFFVIENVRGMLSLQKGKAFERIGDALRSSGYTIEHRVLLAADYGVPQSRIRLFVVGVREDLSPMFAYRFPEPTHSKDPKKTGRKPWVTVGEALAGLPEPGQSSKLQNHIGSQYKVTNRNFTGHRLTNPDKPSPTILARGNGGGGVCAIAHPKNHRRMTVRESALVQTFPIDFKFEGALNSMYRQVGNAVPVVLAQAVASGFYKVVFVND